MKLTKTITVAASGAALLVGASPAAAQLPAINAYSAPSANIQTQVGPANQTRIPTSNAAPTTAKTVPVAQTTPKATGSQLPFTGLDVGLTVAAGAVLLALGFGIRRLVRPSNV